MAADKQTTDQWVAEVCGKVLKAGDAATRERIEAFLNQPAARRIISEWVIPKQPPQYYITDMCDLYKLSMTGVFERIQSKLPGTRVTFSLTVRQRSEARLEQLFAPGGPADLRDKWVRSILDIPNRPFDAGCIRGACSACPLKGVVQLSEELPWAQQPPAGEVSVAIYLRHQQETDQLLWGRIMPIVGGGFGLHFDKGPHAGDVGRLGLEDWVRELGSNLEVVVLADGPWPSVTWFETSMMQLTADTLASLMMRTRGWSEADWHARALADVSRKVEFLNDHLSTAGTPPGGYTVFLFSGRRTPRAGYHLLQNLYLLQHLGKYGGTSSLFAYRVFRSYGWIAADGSWLDAGQLAAKGVIAGPSGAAARRLLLVGTHAHEGSMAFAVIAKAADDDLGYPVSSLIWHMNYWLHTGNFASLPDTYGTACFAHMMRSLKFPDAFTREYRRRFGDLAPGSIYDVVCGKSPLIRQDSGQLEGFLQHFPSGVFRALASEIGDNADIERSASLGYCGCGAGGYFGEKPWTKTAELNGRLDLVAKICRVQLEDTDGGYMSVAGYPVKLGDYEKAGEWYKGGDMPGKFACGPMVTAQGRAALFERYCTMGAVPEGVHVNRPGAAKRKFDELPEAKRQKVFDDWWERFCFVL
eukprot:TRINITY_DN55915_c0_g1_i1.p1 TRINITY_DN55915_c0_g1~~TRINITY_DN55915_c0_g1_i1.p1  ORF type:complete len:689 (+),score=186.58 TRINITY_DN55915_c0_g1_i1:150-2069(+)